MFLSVPSAAGACATITEAVEADAILAQEARVNFARQQLKHLMDRACHAHLLSSASNRCVRIHLIHAGVVVVFGITPEGTNKEIPGQLATLEMMI